VVMSAASGNGLGTARRRVSLAGLAFVVSLLAEIAAFVVVGKLIGFGWAFLALLVVSAVGMWLVGHEGPRAWRRLREVAEAGERPGPKLTRHVVRLVGAVLVAVPGFLSALAGAALFVPPVRVLAGRLVTGFATKRLSSAVAGDLFGPRRVRVRTGPTTHPGTGTRPDQRGDVSEPIEGEIV